MKNSVSKNKFQAEPSSREYERSKSKIYERIAVAVNDLPWRTNQNDG